MKKGCLLLRKNNLISVCDGMGGEDFGEEASFIATSKLASLNPNNLSKDTMLTEIYEINKLICQKMDEKKTRIGSTLVSVILKNDYIEVYNLGDSRAYLLNNKLVQLSKDHTIKNLQGHKKGALTQHLGIYEEEMIIEPFIIDNIKLQKNNYILLCSDGLYDMVTEEEIEKILLSNISDRKKRNKLLERAMENGGKDNITFILIHCI
jgi:protein phosphatase